ncbi:MAG: hypothetical protein GWN01_15265, partial [Nitrosopumilaceae archaeon]|nr:hypothetical protein [Nitrosopumilaceae archaeon]NIU88675.1 hypothetical protein [Nitrosopumilaceae archaeon]NIV66831.1 hypothetical protein [Nitrosopumilaceae archaeon]NIX62803.1 hypothetical protein [Nitrosopumilaceae archaeon]
MNTKLALLFASTLVLLIASSPSMAAAQIDPTILMKLATKAQDEVKQQVSNLDSVPPEIEELDREAS